MIYSRNYNNQYLPAAPFIEIIVKSPNRNSKVSRNLLAFVDTGADATLLPLDTLKSIKAERRDRLQMRDVLGRVASVDLYLVTVVIGDYQITGIQAIALPIGSEPIIGRDVLNQLIVTLNGLAGVVEISD